MRPLNIILASAVFTGIFYYLASTAAPKKVRPRRIATTSRLNPPRHVVAPTASKKMMASEGGTISKESEEDVPWEELRMEFKAELEEKLQQVAPEQAQKIMASYLKERDSFTQKIEALIQERDRSYYFDKERSKIVFTDKLKYKELNKEVTATFEQYNSMVEKIFADHYPVVLETREKFEEYMQIYNRNEFRIGIGL
jgi:hypothetical protein